MSTRGEGVFKRGPHRAFPVRPYPVLLAVLLAVPGALAEDAWPPANHSEHVAAFLWEPQHPARGEAVHAQATLVSADGVQDVLLRVCRVQNYACRAPVAMTAGPDATYKADVPWDRRFYEGVTTQGFAVVLRYANGSTEESPVRDWPGPAGLPEGAGIYYFLTLPPAAKAPSSAAPVVLLALLGLALWRRS